MRYIITENDKNILLQNILDYKYRLYVINSDGNVLEALTAIQSIGSYTVDSDSNVRRTISMTFYLEDSLKNTSVEDKLFDWIGCNFELQIGIYNLRDDAYVWYRCGYYLITEANTSYSAIDNSLSTTLSDWYSKLDGTRNGQIGGAPTIKIPVEETLEDGTKVKHTLKGIVEDTLKNETNIKDFIIDDVGEFYGMPQNNSKYEAYREKHPNWNQLPYDLEYDASSTVADIFNDILGLYPNNQMYFDIYGNFCFNMIPSMENDSAVLDDSFIQKILLSENTESVSYDISNIKNVTEIFGAVYDVDRIAKACVTENNVYKLTFEKIDNEEGGIEYTYKSNDMLAFKVDTNNKDDMKLFVSHSENKNEVIPILYEDTQSDKPIKAGEMEAGKTYAVKIDYSDGKYIAYFLGQFQPHALCVLSNNKADKKYTVDYFAEKYNCEKHNVLIRVEEDSPFAVQKIGEIADCKIGEEYEHIISDFRAKENALYQNRKSTSVYDTVSISTKMIPFLDVQCKVRYRKQQDTETKDYIITAIENDLDSKTSNITMRRFYPLYFNEWNGDD